LLTGAASANQVLVGTNVTFIVTVTNRGLSDATGVLVTNPVPAFVSLAHASANQGSVITVGGHILWNAGVVSNGASASLTIIVVPQAAGLLTNLSGVNGLEADFVPANNVQATVILVDGLPQAVLGSVLPQADGTFQFTLTGQTGLRYVIEASTNLVDWVPLATNNAVGAKIIFTDAAAANLPERFYRALLAP